MTMQLHRSLAKNLDFFCRIDPESMLYRSCYERHLFNATDGDQQSSENDTSTVFSDQFVKGYDSSNYFVGDKLILGTVEDSVSVAKKLTRVINTYLTGGDVLDPTFLKMTKYFHPGMETLVRKKVEEIYTGLGQSHPVLISRDFPDYYHIFNDNADKVIYRFVVIAYLYVNNEETRQPEKVHHVIIKDLTPTAELDGFHSFTYVSKPFTDNFKLAGYIDKHGLRLAKEHVDEVFRLGISSLQPWDRFQVSPLGEVGSIASPSISPCQTERWNSFHEQVEIIKKVDGKLPYKARLSVEYHFKRLSANAHELFMMMKESPESASNLKILAEYFIKQADDHDIEEESALEKYAIKFINLYTRALSDPARLMSSAMEENLFEIPKNAITEVQRSYFENLQSSEEEDEDNVASSQLKKKYMIHVDLLEEIKNTATNLSNIFTFETDSKKDATVLANEFVDALSKANKLVPPMKSFTYKGIQSNDIGESNRQSLIKLNQYFQGKNSKKYFQALIDLISSAKAKREDRIHFFRPLIKAILNIKSEGDANEIGDILAGEICTTNGGIRTVDPIKLQQLLSDTRVKKRPLLSCGIKKGAGHVMIESIRTMQERIYMDLVIDESDRIKFKSTLKKFARLNVFLDIRGINIIAQLADAHRKIPIYCFQEQVEPLLMLLRAMDNNSVRYQ
jgi:hypothetical protein